ncbi:armadillo-type protein [Boletus reticuloceps]|uniref:Armadillo-type protein n=1 Tax=Boletus reticuloceps TaxID=495285 RepID=A0A8I2YLK0_9AGAM|nr:armadillo-type protein [Boletus reticuloceps]
MESLLRWAIENSTGDRAAVPERKDLDPAIIDHILGKPDAQLMKEALDVALDVSKDEDQRITAMDNLEMLVENIDNANNLQKLKMWEPLHGLIGLPSTTDGLKLQTLWVLGTAVQNNPAAQLSYLSLDPIPALLACLSPSSNSAGTRSKAMYTLSSLLKHSGPAVEIFTELQGWNALRHSLEDSDITLRRKTAFLINTLLIPTSRDAATTPSSPVHPNSHASMLSDPASVSTSPIATEALQRSESDSSSLLDALISALVEPVPFGADGENDRDVEFQENVVRLLHTYSVLCGGRFSDMQKHRLRTIFNDVSPASNLFNLGREEFDAIETVVSLT